MCPVELVEDRQRDALLIEYRARKIEPPGRTRVEKILVAARGRWEAAFCARVIERLREAGTARLLSLVAEDNETGTALLAALKRDPGAVGLDSLLTEITKLNDVRKLGLPDGLFADCSEKLAGAGDQNVPLGLPRHGGGRADHAARGRRRSPTLWSSCWSPWPTRSTPAPSGGWRSSSPPS